MLPLGGMSEIDDSRGFQRSHARAAAKRCSGSAPIQVASELHWLTNVWIFAGTETAGCCSLQQRRFKCYERYP
jgi:hypothetical protein